MKKRGRPLEFNDEERKLRKKETATRWRKNNLARARSLGSKAQKIYRVKHAHKIAAIRQAAHFRQMYGLTIQERDAILAAQGGRCAICRSDKPGNTKGWCVDHIHGTKIIRGILCHGCNSALGLLKDDPVRCIAAARYLNTHH